LQNLRRLFVIGFVVLLSTGLTAGELLTLQNSVELAYQKNSQILIAKEQYQAVQAQKVQAFGTAFPSIKLSTSATKMSNPYKDLGALFQILSPSANFSSGGGDLNAYKTQLTLTQMLWGAHVLPVINVADIAVAQAQNNLDRELQNTSLSVTKAFFEVLKARRLLGVMAKSIDLLNEHLIRVETLKEVGIATRAHVLQTKIQLAQMQSQIVQLNGLVQLTEDVFSNAIGSPPGSPIMLDDRVTIAAPSGTNDALVKKALDSRYDVQAMRKLIEILKVNIEVVGSPQWPAVVFNASYDWSNSENFSFDRADQNWMWTVVGSWTLFDGLTTSGKVSEAESVFRQTKLSLEQMSNGIRMEIRKAMIDYEVASKKLEAVSLELDLAKENHEAETIRYENGAGSNLDLMDAYTKLVSAQSSLVTAEYDYEIAKAVLRNVVGE